MPLPSVLLQGLKFDLIVYSPYKSIDGFLDDIKSAAADAEAAAGPGASSEAVAAAAAAAGLDAGMSSLAEEQLDKVRAAAYGAADALMLSDAPLMHTPGRLALAALRSGFGKVSRRWRRSLTAPLLLPVGLGAAVKLLWLPWGRLLPAATGLPRLAEPPCVPLAHQPCSRHPTPYNCSWASSCSSMCIAWRSAVAAPAATLMRSRQRSSCRRR